ncbi:synembryn [Orussus abietinus]|uniref:synembryn n=1 Tax=Orussus abietinus TaxID=222816 RepID=UPI0006264944|nr:synembryn [Orussus abietinus]
MNNLEDLVHTIISGNYEKVSSSLTLFSENYGSKMQFDELYASGLLEDVWKALFSYLSDLDYSLIHDRCLTALRIFSRDNTRLSKLVTTERLQTVLKFARLTHLHDQNDLTDSKIIIESLKLLCNLLFNSTAVLQMLLSDTSWLSCLIKRIQCYSDATPTDMKLFDLRILFLITALDVAARKNVKDNFSGDVHLVNMLKDISRHPSPDDSEKQEENCKLASEILKILFNLYMHSDEVSVEDCKKYNELVHVLNELLLNENGPQQETLHSNIINLLTVIPVDYCSQIVQPIQSTECTAVYRNMDMTAISLLLIFLNQKLDIETNLVENICPVVTALIRLVKAEKLIRKYCRMQVLPPLKDVMKRPEEGTSLRAKLCKLLTTPYTELRDLVAEFLFVLCKENVERMIKYTGYGNAAGMFANKGLLGRRQPDNEYSSDSEDSDTEEYIKHKERINPVTGCYESPKPNPLEGMTEEQKEYEALQLVNLMDKLTRDGVVQPCRVGEDGKPKPLEHVLELQSELPKQQLHHNDSESD